MRALLAGLVALAALSSCGTETGEPAVSGEWTQQLIDDSPGADSPTGLAADGEDVLVVVLGEEATLTTHLSTDGGEFRAGEPVEIEGGGYPGFADPVRLDGVWWLVGTGGMLGEGNDETMAFEPRVLRSEDGLAWEPVDVSGIPSPVDLNQVAAVDGALVAVGSKRNEVDTGGASFEAAAWRSEDGARWTEVALPGVVPQPGYRDESSAANLAVTGDRLLAGGSLSRRAALWSSADAGVTWTRVESPEVHDLYAVSGLVADGTTVVVSGSTVGGSGEGSRLLRSDDGGATFAPSADQPASDGEGFAPLLAGAGRFLTVSRPGFGALGDPELCYADVADCYYGDESDVTLVFASDDGDDWSVLAPPEPDGDSMIGAVGTASGDLVLAHLAKDGISVSRWPDGSPLPEGEAQPEPERVELVTVPKGADPEPGVRYHAPLYVHCGMDWLYLGDKPWQRTDDGPDLETGAGDGPAADWPMAGETIYGFATLTDGGVVEYSIGAGDGAEVIATYEKTGVRPPGCD
jgi:hypothetical protein